MEIPVQREHEEIIIKGKKNKNRQYLEFVKEIKNYTIMAAEALIE
jgi:hypothetical protein